MRKTRITGIVWIIIVLCLYLFKGDKLSSMLLILSILALILSLVFVYLNGNKVKFEIICKDQVEKETEAKIIIKAINNSIIPISHLDAKLTLRNNITNEKRESKISFGMKSKGKDENVYILTSKACGCVDISVSQCKVLDPFKIFSKKIKENIIDKIYIMPNIIELDISKDELNSYDMESYTYSSSQKGNDPSETFGIREYQIGDNPKTIHWKLTGKTGDVVVRELGLPVENSLMIILNNRISEAIENDKVILADKTIEIFLSVSYTLVRLNLAHSISWYNHKENKYISQRVKNEANVFEACGKVLESGMVNSEVSSIWHFLENYENKKFANYILVSSQLENIEDKELLKLGDYGKTKTYLAADYK